MSGAKQFVWSDKIRPEALSVMIKLSNSESIIERTLLPERCELPSLLLRPYISKAVQVVSGLLT